MKNFIVAIDGPNGAGKSTIARELARRMGCTYIDTGAMYRAIGLYVLRRGVSSEDCCGIVRLLDEIDIRLEHREDGQHIFLGDEDVSSEIRTPEASIYASNVSKIGEVRAALLDLQRGFADTGSIVMDGRDIGTVVFPNADIKIFLTASVERRAERRHKELTERGERVSLEEVRYDLEWRDKNDSTRKLAPLKPAEDAVLVDTSEIGFEDSVELVRKIVEEKLG